VHAAAIIVGLVLLAICLFWTYQYFFRRRV
jgi:hypothetical protein